MNACLYQKKNGCDPTEGLRPQIRRLSIDLKEAIKSSVLGDNTSFKPWRYLREKTIKTE